MLASLGPRHIVPVIGLVLAIAAPAGAQCILANPSFELAGQGGAAFGGWNQFGVVGSSTVADHGHIAALLTGPDQGGWDVSGVWQQLDTTPGEAWQASVAVLQPSAHPLTGQSVAFVNIEWRDSGGGLINYESHAAATAATPTDAYEIVTVQSGPAPAGAVAVHLLLGILQEPGSATPQVVYDLVQFTSLQSPLDDQQWNDFPGGRTLAFAGRTWRVKGPGWYGPGPNLFSDSEQSVWVDAGGDLHLTNRQVGSNWYSTEIALTDTLGYGDYVFTTVGRLDLLDPAVVFGLFLWQYGPCYDPAYLWWNPYNEIDIEFSRWGNPGLGIAQFVAQPADYPGNILRFDPSFADGEVTSHAFRWLPDRVEYRSWRGGPADESAGTLIRTWTYTGPHIPRPEQPRVHLNLWRFDAPPASDQEVVLRDFTFVPLSPVIAVDDRPHGAVPAVQLLGAWPNPLNPRTTIRFTAARDGALTLAIYDIGGRMVRTLCDGPVAAGDHAVVWDGRDGRGRLVPSGVYLYQLRGQGAVETRRLAVVR